MFFHRGGGDTARSASSASGKISSASTGRHHDEFVRKMEERALERARLKAEREQKRKEKDLEKLVCREAIRFGFDS